MKTDITTIEKKSEELHKAFTEIFQGRSDFQLEKFVVNSHLHPERQYAQCVIELQTKYYNIKRADISRRRIQQEIDNSQCQFEIEEKQLDLEQLEIALIGDLREFEMLYKIFQTYPKYTNEELQKAEHKYWADRLAMQAQQDIDSHGTISTGNADALRQIGLLGNYSERFFELFRDHPGLQKKELDKIDVCSDKE